MKTAIQQMMTAIEKEMPRLLNTSTSDGRKFIDLVYPYFEIEMEQIKAAYKDGAFEKIRHLDTKKFKMPAEYYNETFKTK